jgi:hypothetical protein
MKRGYYRDPRLGGGPWRDMLEREAQRRVDERERAERACLDRWADDGGSLPSTPPPEFIMGLGQWKAGRGSIVTSWCTSQEEAAAEYYRLVED